jgi:hypothetical protein
MAVLAMCISDQSLVTAVRNFVIFHYAVASNRAEVHSEHACVHLRFCGFIEMSHDGSRARSSRSSRYDHN